MTQQDMETRIKLLERQNENFARIIAEIRREKASSLSLKILWCIAVFGPIGVGIAQAVLR